MACVCFRDLLVQYQSLDSTFDSLVEWGDNLFATTFDYITETSDRPPQLFWIDTVFDRDIPRWEDLRDKILEQLIAILTWEGT